MVEATESALFGIFKPCHLCETTGTRRGYEDEPCRSCGGRGYTLTGSHEDVLRVIHTLELLHNESKGREE